LDFTQNLITNYDYSETNTSQVSTHSFESLHELYVECSDLDTYNFYVCLQSVDVFCSISVQYKRNRVKPLNAELNPICYLLALLGDHIFSTLAG